MMCMKSWSSDESQATIFAYCWFIGIHIFKGWYWRHSLKGLADMEEEDNPEESFRPFSGIADLLRHWLAECQQMAMVACRREILESLPHPKRVPALFSR